MLSSTVDQSLWFAGFAGQLALILVLIARREYLRFPVFLTGIIFSIASDTTLFWISSHQPGVYSQAYTISAILDYMLQFGILVEIGHSVLRPGHPSLARRTLILLSLVLLAGFAAALIWTPSHQAGGNFRAVFAKLRELDLIFAFMRLAAFALIAGFSQMLGITWRNHVIRLAGGLAFYSAMSLILQITISHLSQTNHEAYRLQYDLLSRIQVTSYLAALTFWVWSFVQKDAPRKEFTPQMERFLVTLSETARRSRLGFARSGHK